MRARRAAAANFMARVCVPVADAASATPTSNSLLAARVCSGQRARVPPRLPWRVVLDGQPRHGLQHIDLQVEYLPLLLGSMPHLEPHTSHLTPHTSHLTPHTSHLTPHTSHLTPHTSHHTPHTSHLTPHTSHLTPHTSGMHRTSLGWTAALPSPLRPLAAAAATRTSRPPPSRCLPPRRFDLPPQVPPLLQFHLLFSLPMRKPLQLPRPEAAEATAAAAADARRTARISTSGAPNTVTLALCFIFICDICLRCDLRGGADVGAHLTLPPNTPQLAQRQRHIDSVKCAATAHA